ncbi:MAG: ABC transporter permease, partial [Bacteroidota bacterium]
MFQNYIKLAFRNLRKHKTFSFINIFGLAISMSICLLIMLNIKDAHSYDSFHPEGSERTFRILTDALRKDGGSESYASSPFPVSRALAEDYSQVELWTPLVNRLSTAVRMNGKELYLQGFFTDSTFFKMFGFELLAGDPAAALAEPHSLVLTEDWALRLFNQKDHFEALLGKTIELPGYGREFKITGILAKAPGKTHLQFDALGSLATQFALEKMVSDSVEVAQVTSEWRDYYSTYNFVRLKPGAKAKAAEAALADIAKNKLAGLELESRDKGYRYTLQALGDITPGRMLSQGMGNGVPSMVLWFMSGLGLIIMLCACFNYTNLTIARSLVRTKEVGVRKVLGARRSQVFWQFIGEAVVVSVLALLVAYNILLLTKPLNFLDAAEKMQAADWKIYGLFLLFAVAVGFVAGALPAATLSKTSPLQVLQKLQNVKLIQRVGLRKVLIGFQFTVTLVFL